MSKDSRKIESIFCGDKDWQANACLNWAFNPISLYAKGYKEAGDRVVEFVLKEAKCQDILTYPIVFLYRQYIELRLKEIIREGGILLDLGKDFEPHHDLLKLWCTAKEIAKKVFEGDDSTDLKYTEHVITEFSQIDPDSFSFRYPETKKGDNSLDGIRGINIRRVSEHVEELSKDLEGISFGISIYRDWKGEMLSDCY